MDEEMFRALIEVIEAIIDEKIEDAFGRDGGREYLRAYDLKKEFVEKHCK